MPASALSEPIDWFNPCLWVVRDSLRHSAHPAMLRGYLLISYLSTIAKGIGQLHHQLPQVGGSVR